MNENTMQEKMKKWQEMATPGAQHKLLEPLVGNWRTEAHIWPDGPDKPGMHSQGTAEIKWILGERFLQEEDTGEMMGRPFAGQGFYGYDNFGKRFQFLWMDSSSTGMFTGHGQFNDKERAIIYLAKMGDVLTGEQDKPVCCLIRIISKDQHVFEMYDSDKPNPKRKTGEITYTRM